MTTRRPDRIDQVIPSIIEHDAVSNHTFEAQRLLREMGYESEIYASTIGPGCAGRVHPLATLPHLGDGTQWLLYQCSIGSPAAEIFSSHPGPKLLDYHNITPASLVERWLPPLAAEARLGREQLRMLAPLCESAFADSNYNKSELDDAGFQHTSVASVLVEQGNFNAALDAGVLESVAVGKRSGGADWLFVGQLAPHKAQHDVIRAFACYRTLYDSSARLHLVGREMGSTYRDALERFVRLLGLKEVVNFTGAVPVAALAAYYEACDVFVCCSEHEGFCAPIIEAMSHELPVVAYGAAAVTETVGDAGMLLSEKTPLRVAASVHEVLRDEAIRERLIVAGRAQATRYSPEAARTQFTQAVAEAVARA